MALTGRGRLVMIQSFIQIGNTKAGLAWRKINQDVSRVTPGSKRHAARYGVEKI